MTKTLARTLVLALLAGTLCAVLPSPAAAARSDAKKLDRMIDKGRKDLSKERYEKALDRFTAADRLAGGSSPEALAGLADAYLGLERYQEAIDSGDRLLKVATDDRQRSKAQNLIALAYFDRARADQMDLRTKRLNERDLSKDTEEEARQRDELHRRADAVQQEFLAAADAFRRVIELTGGKYSVSWENYAEALYQGNRYGAALKVLDQLEAKLPDGAELSEHAARLRSCVEVLAPSDESPVYDLSNLPDGPELAPPRRVYSPTPQYTDVARMNRLQGVVIVQGVITKKGDYICVEVLQGLPLGLTESALETLRTWKFEPATLDGKPVTARYVLTTNFRLQ